MAATANPASAPRHSYLKTGSDFCGIGIGPGRRGSYATPKSKKHTQRERVGDGRNAMDHRRACGNASP